MSNDVNAGNINSELLDEFVQDNFHIISHIIEGQLGGSNIKQAPYVPLDVDGRQVDMIGRHQSRGAAVEINDLKELIDEAITHRLDYENVNPHDRVMFVEQFNPEEIRSESITWQLLERKVGTTSQGRQMNARRHNWRPQLREVVYDPDKPNKRLYIYGQWFDNVIELTCWARTNKAADKRALWLEELMLDYTWFFLYKGISAMRYEGRGPDKQIKATVTEGNKLHCRPLRFYVRTEKISHISTYTLADLLIKARLTTDAIS